MKIHAQCFCIKVVPFSVMPQTCIATLPFPDGENFDECESAWNFLRKTFSDILPSAITKEEEMRMTDDEGDEQGFFFSCSDLASDDHYHLVMKYTFF